MTSAERTFIGYSDAHISAFYENARQRRIERQQAARRAFARSDFLTAALCDNLMSGRDPWAGFPKPVHPEGRRGPA